MSRTSKERTALRTVWMVLLVSSAAAASTFSDDFETGTLLPTQAPAGKWDPGGPVAANCELTTSASAAHRGALGLRVVDSDGTAGQAIEVQLIHNYHTASPDQYIRFWFRITESNGIGSSSISQLINDVDYIAMAEIFVDFNNGHLSIGGFDAAKNYTSDMAAIRLELGGWHLIEYSVTGVGTVSGGRALWVDGALQARHGGLNFVGRNTVEMHQGEPWANSCSFEGILDFDDIATDVKPMTSTLQWSAPSHQSTVSACTPMTVHLEDSNGSPTADTRDVEVALAVNGVAGGFFSDLACGSPMSRAVVAAGQTQQLAYFKADAQGSMNLSADQTDFMGARLSMQACSADGQCDPPGTACTGAACDPQRGPARGCSNTGNGWVPASLGLLGGLFHRRTKLGR